MNLDRIARSVVATIAPQVIIERRLNNAEFGPAVDSRAVQEAWYDLLTKFGLSTDGAWVSAEEFFRAYLAFGVKLSGLSKMLAEMVADMAQEAMENGYPEFSPKGISFVSRRSACKLCPPERRFAGLIVTARIRQ